MYVANLVAPPSPSSASSSPFSTYPDSTPAGDRRKEVTYPTHDPRGLPLWQAFIDAALDDADVLDAAGDRGPAWNKGAGRGKEQVGRRAGARVVPRGRGRGAMLWNRGKGRVDCVGMQYYVAYK